MTPRQYIVASGAIRIILGKASLPPEHDPECAARALNAYYNTAVDGAHHHPYRPELHSLATGLHLFDCVCDRCGPH